MLEFQARQTRSAARLALAYPNDGDFVEYALHGFRYLRDVLWDRQHGGWFWLLDADGTPLAGETKHAHAGSYAVQACALVFEATGDRGCIELALEGFTWFERHAIDPEHGGYHSWFHRDGTVIRSPSDVPPGVEPIDPLKHAPGLKNINVQGDWFEALGELGRVTDRPAVAARFEHLAGIYLRHLTTPSGESCFAFAHDWTPESGPEEFGYNFQAAHRLLAAAPSLPNLPCTERAFALARHAHRAAKRRGGGYAFSDARNRKGPLDASRFGPRRRAWWVQFEALRAFTLFAARPGANQRAFARLLEAQWDYCSKYLLDDRFGGVFGTDPRDLAPWARPPANHPYLAKSNPWKDASHDTDAMVTVLQTLRATTS